MTQPVWQPCLTLPPRSSVISRCFSPEMRLGELEAARGEVAGRVAAGLVEDVGQHVGAVRRQALARDRRAP